MIIYMALLCERKKNPKISRVYYFICMIFYSKKFCRNHRRKQHFAMWVDTEWSEHFSSITWESPLMFITVTPTTVTLWHSFLLPLITTKAKPITPNFGTLENQLSMPMKIKSPTKSSCSKKYMSVLNRTTRKIP